MMTEATTPTTAATSTTSAPETTTTPAESTTTLAAIGSLDSGLFCRDVAALGYRYADAVAYWTREGRPDRMDADRSGIPCETVYDHAAVVAFWGEPLPTTTTTKAVSSPTTYSVSSHGFFPEPLSGSGEALSRICARG
jgi:hypothetical protein